MWRMLIAVMLTAVCGCGGDTTSADPDEELGIYNLVSLDGRAVPTSITEGDWQVEVLSSTVTLSAGRKLRMSTTYRTSPGATPVSRELTGSYTIKGNALTYTIDGKTNTATLNGDVLQMLIEWVVWLYRRS